MPKRHEVLGRLAYSDARTPCRRRPLGACSAARRPAIVPSRNQPADVSNPLAFADGSVYTSSTTSTAFASNRHVDIDFSDPILAGFAPQAVTFDFDFADDKSDCKTMCFYFEVRRASDTTIADDRRVRVYAGDEGANSWLIDRATISVRAYGKTSTEYPVLGTDVLTTTP
jgi:hypothetical protein